MELCFQIEDEFIAGLRDLLGYRYLAHMCRDALTLLQWASEESEKGREIYSGEGVGGRGLVRLRLPKLDELRSKSNGLELPLSKALPVTVDIVRLPHYVASEMPSYATGGSSGMDLCAAIAEPVTIPWGSRMLIGTGISVAVPEGYELQIRSRSGMSLRRGVVVANSPGTVDSDYRGEVGVILQNAGSQPYVVDPGDRIAQAVLAPVFRIEWNQVEALDETVRGSGGYGSTGG